MNANTKQHGGKRPGAGRKPRHGSPMIPKTVRLPKEWIATLIADYGTFQAGIESLVEKHIK